MINQHQATPWKMVLFLFFITSMVESMSMSHVFSFMPVYLQSMHVAHLETWVGILSAITFVTGLPLVPLWGVWAQRYGGKIVIVRSAYVEMLVFLVLGFSHALPGVLAAMMLVGFQLGNTGIMLAAIRQASPDGRVGFAVSVFSVSSSIGMAGGPVLGGLVTGLHLLNLHGLYVLDAILSLITGSMLLLFYREPAKEHMRRGSQNHHADGVQQSAWQQAWQSIRFTFSLPVTWTLFSIYTVVMMARQMVNPYLPIAIEHLPLHGVSSTVSIGGLMGLSAIIGAVITVVAGRIGDKLGFSRILLLVFVCLIPATILLGLSRNVAVFTIGLTGFSAGYSIAGAMVFALFSTRIPESHRSTAMNLVYLPLYLGGIIGPAVSSVLTKAGLFGPFLGASVLFVLGAVVVVATRRHTTEVSAPDASAAVTG